MPEHVCPDCGTTWASEAACDRCCDSDDLTWRDPSRRHLSYEVGYD